MAWGAKIILQPMSAPLAHVFDLHAFASLHFPKGIVEGTEQPLFIFGAQFMDGL